MKIKGSFRSTGMGAYHGTAIPVYGKWTPIREAPGVRFHGRDRGYNNYSLEAPDDQVWANFYRSNSGKESVNIFQGEVEIASFNSFEDADYWLKEDK